MIHTLWVLAVAVAALLPTNHSRVFDLPVTGIHVVAPSSFHQVKQGDATVARLLQGYHREVKNALLWEIIPDYNRNFKGIAFRTNAWGMHDKAYSLARPANTYRIALLGSSITVGAGVAQDEVFETLLEERLNREGPGAPAKKFEILNFSAGAYGVLQNVLVTEQKVFGFKPNAIMVGVFSVEPGRMRSYLLKLVKSGYAFPDPYVRAKLAESGANASMEDPELMRRLGPISNDLIRWSYKRIVELARQNKVAVIGLVIPEPEPRFGRNIATSAQLAAEAGLPLLDLRGVYDGISPDSLRLPGSDPHWNARGNKLVAERAFDLLRKNDAAALKLGFSTLR